MDDQFYRQIIAARIFPCLTLHIDRTQENSHDNNETLRIDRTQDTSHDDDDVSMRDFPNFLAMPVNYRKIILTRFGIRCQESDEIDQRNSNLFIAAVNEEQGHLPSFLGGQPFLLVVTSFEERMASRGGEDYTRMISAVFHDDDDNGDNSRSFHGVPLSLDIINDANKWLCGLDQFQEAKSVEEGLKVYIQQLRNRIPLLRISTKFAADDLQTALSFLDTHDWGSAHEQEQAQFLIGRIAEVAESYRDIGRNTNEAAVRYRKLRCETLKFIYKNLARRTKVVVHIVDGIHRLTALEYALVWPLTKQEFTMELETNVCCPTQVNNAFVTKMLNLSNETQNQQGCLKDHGKKEFYKELIQLLDNVCTDKKFMIDEENNMMNDSATTLQQDIEHFGSLVLDVLFHDDSRKKYGLDPDLNLGYIDEYIFHGTSRQGKLHTIALENRDEVLSRLFKNNNGDWSLHVTTLKNNSLLTKKCNYERSVVHSSLFELAQVLMWTRTSNKSRYLLFDFFSKNHPTPAAQLSSGSPDLTNKWVTSMVNAIATCVYYSYRVCTAKKIVQSSDEKRYLQPRLITSAIESMLPFFSKTGVDPKTPEWFNSLSKRLKEEKLQFPDNYNTLVTVAYALHLEVGILVERESSGRGKKAVREFEEEVNVNNDPNHLFQNGNFFTPTDGAEKKWTLNIQSFVDSLSKPDNNNFYNNTVDHLIRFYAMGNSKTCMTEGNMSINRHSDEQYAILRELLTQVKSKDFGKYLTTILVDGGLSDELKCTAKQLLDKINNLDEQLLTQFYVRGVDMDSGEKVD